MGPAQCAWTGCYQIVISPRCFGIDGGVWGFVTVIGGVIRCKAQGPGMLNISTIHSTKICLRSHLTFHCPTGSGGKNPPANAGDEGQEDPLEKELATHFSILA